MKIFLTVLNYRADTIFIAKISKGHNSVKNADGNTVLFLCTSSDCGLYFYKFHENILNGFRVMARTRFFIRKISKGHNSVTKCRWSVGSCSLHIV